MDAEVCVLDVFETDRKHWAGNRVREGIGYGPMGTARCKDLPRAHITALVDHSEPLGDEEKFNSEIN